MAGVISALKQQGGVESAVELKVASECQRLDNGKIKCQLTDGKENIASVFTSQVAREFGAELKTQALVRVQEANVSAVGDGHLLIVAKAELLGAGEHVAAKLAGASAVAATPAEPMQGVAAPVEPAAEAAAKTPAAALRKTSAALAKTSPYATPANHPTPPSAGWAQRMGTGSASKRPLQPISALNPYNNNWSIKAKVLSKQPKRAFSKGFLLNVELVDEQGTAIEATFWRDAADRADELLEEGKVYIFGRGNVKPADKRYSRVRNDYALHFDPATFELESCAEDIDTSKMHDKLDFVAIDQLAAYVDKKMLVDVLGVVAEVRPLGSVKRKTDQVELSRRDITLVDQSLKTVVVTLWGSSAEGVGRELEEQAEAAPVVAISACRVSSYNGVSVSAVQRSAVLINPPDIPEAAALRQWYDASGRGAPTIHVGEGLATAFTRSGGAAQQERSMLQAFQAATPATPQEKPHYATVMATVAAINPDQSMYYMANPENNRKVVEQGGQYFCEYDNTTIPCMVHRYIFVAKVVDETGECTVQVFNEQAEQLLGMTADELAKLRADDDKRYRSVLNAALWKNDVLRLKAQVQEYQGEMRQRFSVADIRPTNYASESRRLLGLIEAASS